MRHILTIASFLQVWPSAGVLAARSDAIVTVDFSAIEKREVSEVITLEVQLWAQRKTQAQGPFVHGFEFYSSLSVHTVCRQTPIHILSTGCKASLGLHIASLPTSDILRHTFWLFTGG